MNYNIHNLCPTCEPGGSSLLSQCLPSDGRQTRHYSLCDLFEAMPSYVCSGDERQGLSYLRAMPSYVCSGDERQGLSYLSKIMSQRKVDKPEQCLVCGI